MEIIKSIAKYVVIGFLFSLFLIWCFLDIKAVILLFGAAGIWVIAYVLYAMVSGDHINVHVIHKMKVVEESEKDS